MACNQFGGIDMDEIIVSIKTRFGHYYEAVKVDPILYEAFEPLRETDMPIMAYICGETLVASDEAKRIIKMRQNTADELAKEISQRLVRAMSTNDTFNGYGK
ncbi:MAG: hypothetical protein ACR2MX_01635 [Cyclobacteriaceae bacterium]